MYKPWFQHIGFSGDLWACCGRYPIGILIPIFKTAGFILRVKNHSLNESNPFQLVLSGPAVTICEGLILDPCIICTNYTYKKCGLKSLGTTRSLIVNMVFQ